jgi:hypothetical protein
MSQQQLQQLNVHSLKDCSRPVHNILAPRIAEADPPGEAASVAILTTYQGQNAHCAVP